jgi:hypothetical protein
MADEQNSTSAERRFFGLATSSITTQLNDFRALRSSRETSPDHPAETGDIRWLDFYA